MCVHMCVRVCARACACACMWVCAHVCMCTCVHMCVRVRTHVCGRVCVHMCVRAHVRVHVCVCVLVKGFPGGASGKEIACQCRGYKRFRFNPWVWKIPWRRAWQPTPVFLPGEAHGRRSLVGYSPYDRKESDVTEAT